MKYSIKILLTVFVGAVLIAIDLITKALAEFYFGYQHLPPTGYFLGIVRLELTWNPGIAFGIASENPVVMAIITAFTVVLIIGITVVAFTLFRKNTPARMALAVIIAGAIGNLVDRLVFGQVRDFVDFTAFHPFGWLGSDFNFGICNVADFYITFGAVALIFIILFIGPSAAFPLTKKWRQEAKRIEAEKERKKMGKVAESAEEDARRQELRSGEIAPEEECVFRRDPADTSIENDDEING